MPILLLTVLNLKKLKNLLKINFGIKNYYLILNRVKKEENQEPLLEEIKKANLELAGMISEDSLVYEFDIQGKPLIQLPEDSSAIKDAYSIFDKIVG